MRVELFATLIFTLGCGRIGFARDDGGLLIDVVADDSGPGASGIDAFVTPGTATMGTTQVGGSNQNTGSNRIWISKFLLGEAGTMQRLVAYFGTGGGQSANVRGVIYSDVAGKPAMLVAVTNAIFVAPQTNQTWVALDLATAQPLVAGTYWLGVHNDSAIQLAFQTSIGATKFVTDAYSDGADPTWAGGTTTYNMQISIYGEYTVP